MISEITKPFSCRTWMEEHSFIIMVSAITILVLSVLSCFASLFFILQAAGIPASFIPFIASLTVGCILGGGGISLGFIALIILISVLYIKFCPSTKRESKDSSADAYTPPLKANSGTNPVIQNALPSTTKPENDFLNRLCKKQTPPPPPSLISVETPFIYWFKQSLLYQNFNDNQRSKINSLLEQPRTNKEMAFFEELFISLRGGTNFTQDKIEQFFNLLKIALSPEEEIYENFCNDPNSPLYYTLKKLEELMKIDLGKELLELIMMRCTSLFFLDNFDEIDVRDYIPSKISKYLEDPDAWKTSPILLAWMCVDKIEDTFLQDKNKPLFENYTPFLFFKTTRKIGSHEQLYAWNIGRIRALSLNFINSLDGDGISRQHLEDCRRVI